MTYSTIVADPPWHYDKFLQAPDAGGLAGMPGEMRSTLI